MSARRSRLPHLTLLVGLTLMAPASTLAQGKIKHAFRNGEPVEAKQTDGNWYAGAVYKLDRKALRYEIRWKGMPTNADSWVEEADVRKAGSGPVSDPTQFQSGGAAATPVAPAVSPTAPTATAASSKVSYRNGQPVEALQRDGRWYAGTIYKVDAKAGKFLIRFTGLPVEAESWMEAAQLRAPGSGEVVDPAQLMAAMQARRDQMAPKPPESPAMLSEADATALEAAYRAAYEAAKNFPFEADAAGLVEAASTLEALDLARLESRLAADRGRFPAVFQYYGMDEKGRYGDLPWGGQKRPAFGHPLAEKLNTYYLPAIFQARARLDKHPEGPAGAVKLAVDRAGDPEGARKAIRLAKALLSTRPGAPGLSGGGPGAVGGWGAIHAAATQAVAARATPKAAQPAVRKRPVVDVSKIDSGVGLSLSKRSEPGAPAETSFQAGDSIYLHVRFPGPILKSLKSPVVSDQVHLVLYLDQGDVELDYTSASIRFVHLNAESLAGDAGYVVIPLVSDPDQDCFVYSNNLFNRQTWQTLAQLPPGKHTLGLRLDSSVPKVEGVPLAVSNLDLEVTPAGVAAWTAKVPALDKAFYDRGGELVRTGRILEGPGDFKLVASENGVRVGYRSGVFQGNDFWIGIFRAGKRMSDHYSPEGSLPYFVRRGEGAYEVVFTGDVVGRFAYADGTFTGRDGKVHGKFVNQWNEIVGVRDLMPVVAGLVHFTDRLRK